MNSNLLRDVLKYRSSSFEEDARKLSIKFSSLRRVSEADFYSLSDALDGNMQTSVYLKLLFAIASRRVCDNFKLGCKHSDEDVVRYLKAIMLDLSDETVYLVSITADGRVVAFDRVGSGTVNSSNILPRRILEIAKIRGAAEVIVAHNHPGGHALPSDDDIVGTRLLRELLSSLKINLRNHYVIAGGEYSSVPL